MFFRFFSFNFHSIHRNWGEEGTRERRGILHQILEKASKTVPKNYGFTKFCPTILNNQGVYSSRIFSLAKILVIWAFFPEGQVKKHTFQTKMLNNTNIKTFWKYNS